jgi:hypothetical protein
MCIEGYEESRGLLVVSKDRLVEVTKATSDLLLEVEESAHAAHRTMHEVRGRHNKRLNGWPLASLLFFVDSKQTGDQCLATASRAFNPSWAPIFCTNIFQ